MNDTASFLVIAAAMVGTSLFGLLQRSKPQRVGGGGAHSERRITSIALTIGIPLAVVALYARLGNLDAVTPAPQDPVRTMAEERTTTLAARLATTPDDVAGLRLLARSYEQLGRMQQAIATYEQLAAARPDDPDALVDLADALSMTQGGSYVGEPITTVRKALAIDGANSRALAAVANEAAQRDDLPTAIASWERIASQVPFDSEVGRSLRADIAGAKAAIAARNSKAEATADPSAKPDHM